MGVRIPFERTRVGVRWGSSVEWPLEQSEGLKMASFHSPQPTSIFSELSTSHQALYISFSYFLLRSSRWSGSQITVLSTPLYHLGPGEQGIVILFYIFTFAAQSCSIMKNQEVQSYCVPRGTELEISLSLSREMIHLVGDWAEGPQNVDQPLGAASRRKIYSCLVLSAPEEAGFRGPYCGCTSKPHVPWLYLPNSWVIAQFVPNCLGDRV